MGNGSFISGAAGMDSFLFISEHLPWLDHLAMRLFLLALATLLGCTNSATVNVSTTAPQLDGASRYVGGPRWERPSATTVVIEPYDVPVVTEPGF